jgi:hypothetical protein
MTVEENFSSEHNTSNEKEERNIPSEEGGKM